MDKLSKPYTYQDRLGVTALVSALVGHPVACGAATRKLIEGKEGPNLFIIQPLRAWLVRDFYLHSAYRQTRQHYDSPVEAALHYTTHYLAFKAHSLEQDSSGPVDPETTQHLAEEPADQASTSDPLPAESAPTGICWDFTPKLG